MKLEYLIIACLPGTGREIADRVIKTGGHPNANQVTPNVVYQVLSEPRYAKFVKRSIIIRNNVRLNYFERRVTWFENETMLADAKQKGLA